MPWLSFSLLMFIPWLATWGGSMLGASMRLEGEDKQAAFLGFAGGIMVAASIWSLIVPAFNAITGWAGALTNTAGFVLGCLGMLLLDRLLPHQHPTEESPEGRPSHLSRPLLLVMAVALHNIPEGLALGVVIAATLRQGLPPLAAAVFGLGLALQNFPEGMAVVVPLRESGMPRGRCIRFGTLASFAEPVAALAGLGLSFGLVGLGGAALALPLSIAAGAMMFIVVEELIPASQAGHTGHAPTYGFLIGFWAMAVMGILAA
ncbi:MAG: ZIP family metal transporter [Oscillospiraceae bacterium]|jgi:ZIP family zinc transporter|nr:ZIP family metal transporter [Oscillospiraceae bacterium]